MKLIHTSDWHLGKKLYKVSRLPEQQLFLDWLATIIIEQKIDGLIIAGDIFDTPSPPAEALKLYFDFLQRITTQSNCHIFAIAGNHDSGRFLEAPQSLLHERKVHIKGMLSNNISDFQFQLGDLNLFLLPYFRTHEILNLGKSFDIENNDEDMSSYILRILHALFERIVSLKSHILVAHHLFGHYEASGSEQSLSLSGIDSIPLSLLDNFNYVALGHIHKKQQLCSNTYYCGSPLPFRFSETRNKSLILITTAQGQITNTELVDIPIFRQVLTLETTADDLESQLKKLVDDHTAAPYNLSHLLEVKLKLDCPQYGLADYVREYLSSSPIELLSLQSEFQNDDTALEQQNYSSVLPNTMELFDLFYRKKYPETEQIPAPIKEEFIELLDEINQGEQ